MWIIQHCAKQYGTRNFEANRNPENGKKAQHTMNYRTTLNQ